MNIKQYKDFQFKAYSHIMNIANGIDIKLLGILTFDDLFNDKYRSKELQEYYNELVKPLIEKYRTDNAIHIQTVLCNIINDAAQVLDKTGYLTSTGAETTVFDCRVPNDYIPCIELEGLIEGVYSLQYRYQFKPYWAREEYSLFGNNETVSITPASLAETFIDDNRKKFSRTFAESSLGKMARSVRIQDKMFDYDIHIPQISPAEERYFTNKYEEAVRRHLILKKLMDDECTGKIYNSTIDKDGNVTLECYYD